MISEGGRSTLVIEADFGESGNGHTRESFNSLALSIDSRLLHTDDCCMKAGKPALIATEGVELVASGTRAGRWEIVGLKAGQSAIVHSGAPEYYTTGAAAFVVTPLDGNVSM